VIMAVSNLENAEVTLDLLSTPGAPPVGLRVAVAQTARKRQDTSPTGAVAVDATGHGGTQCEPGSWSLP
jgi:hypothetical protein